MRTTSRTTSTRTFPVLRLVCRALFCLAAAVACLLATPPAARAAGPAPAVLRTLTHHQVTSLPRGVSPFRPVVSSSGNRILFGVAAGDGHLPGLAVVDFDGGNLVNLDEGNPVGPGALSADGSRVAYVVNYAELRSIGGDGRDRRTLVKSVAGAIDAVRLTADGKIVYFLASRGFDLNDGKNTTSYVRGVYSIYADGTHLRRVAGPDEVAPVRGAKPDDVGSPNFRTEYPAGSMDVSADGREVVFGCYDKAGWFLVGCDNAGKNLHVISERRSQAGVPTQQFLSIALSADGTTVAYQCTYPNELGVVGFGGKGEKSLLKEGQDIEKTHPIGFGAEPIYITADGARFTYVGRHINADGSGWFQLLKTHQDHVLSYREYETPASDAFGRRFAYWILGDGPMQLATMELDVAPAGLRGAPRLSEITVDPGAIPRQKDGVAASKTSARAAATPMPDHLSCSGFKDGLYDTGIMQNGRFGITDLLDDGKTDGDAKAGDGVYTRRWLSAYPQTPADGSWTIRFEGQIQDGNKMYHGQVVEVGPFPIVDGQPPAGPVTLEGTPPPPPTVNPVPGTPIAGPGSTPGTTNGPGTTTTPGTPGAGAINLTGYWKSDSGAIYFVRQVGDKVLWSMDGLPGVRNAFYGSITGGTLTGTWADLPGGTAIETGTGTLTLKIESNDKLTKVSSTSNYGDSTLVRIAKPAGASVGISGVASGGGASGGGASGGGASGGGAAGTAGKAPWETTQGRALIDRWAAETEAKLNGYNGDQNFNSRKQYHFNKYGILEDKNLHSAFAPDNFKDYGYDRYHYMWDIWVPGAGGWDRKEWNALGIPSLRDYVLKGLKG